MRHAAIIGAGRLGTTLARALAGKGYRITGIACATLEEAEQSRLFIGTGSAFEDIRKAAEKAELVILTVPDQKILETARELAREKNRWNGRMVWHCSGLKTVAALSPLEGRGALTAAVHPVQSFPDKKGGPERLRGVFFGIEAGDAAWNRSRKIVEKLEGRPFRIQAEEKPLYHAACSTASNLLVSLLDAAAAMLRETGRTAPAAGDILLPLVQGTLQNVKELDVRSALTGPVVRGDTATVAAHLKALSNLEEERAVYLILARRSLKLAQARGDLPRNVIQELADLLEDK